MAQATLKVLKTKCVPGAKMLATTVAFKVSSS